MDKKNQKPKQKNSKKRMRPEKKPNLQLSKKIRDLQRFIDYVNFSYLFYNLLIRKKFPLN